MVPFQGKVPGYTRTGRRNRHERRQPALPKRPHHYCSLGGGGGVWVGWPPLTSGPVGLRWVRSLRAGLRVGLRSALPEVVPRGVEVVMIGIAFRGWHCAKPCRSLPLGRFSVAVGYP